MIKRQVTYMIGVRPIGSFTFTPCPDKAVSEATSAYANFFATKDRADKICAELAEYNPELQFQIFEFREVGFTATLSENA